MQSAYQGHSSSTALKLTLSALPREGVVVSVVAVDSNNSPLSLFFPPQLTFRNTSQQALTVVVAFTGTYLTGLFSLNVSLSGSSSTEFALTTLHQTFQVLALNQEPVTPLLLSGQFSNDATLIILSFSSATVGGASGLSRFPCSSLLSFQGVGGSVCQW